MKIFYFTGFKKYRSLKKWGRIMRLSFLFFFGFLLVANASSYSQTTRLNINLKNGSIIDVIETVEENSEFVFLYKNQDLNLNRKVTLKMKEATIQQVLDAAFKEQNVNWDVYDRQIVIHKTDDTGMLMQQQKTITGVVTDQKGELLTGVTVVVKGTTKGTVTDIDGKFSLEIPDDTDVLQFSFIGMKTIDVPIQGKTMMTVVMQDETFGVDEVVVVGYGTQKKINVTGAVAQVSIDKIKNKPITNISQGLSGLLPGVTVVQNTGQPGADGGTIRIRGIGSFSGSRSTPMVIVDGVESSLSQVLPEDVESVSVLKDASSAAIYGSKAANGVIIVTTKKGKKGETDIQYNANFGWQHPTDLIDKMNSADYAVAYNEALVYDGKKPRWSDDDIKKFRDGSSPYTHPNTDWHDLFYVGSGFQQKHNLSFSGGSDKITYMNSLGYQNQDGIIEHSSNEKYFLRSNVHTILTSKLTSNFNLSFTHSSQQQPTNPYTSDQEQIFRQVNRIAPWVLYKNKDGSYGTIGDGNPIAWMDLNATNDIKKNYFTALTDIKYQIFDDLSIKAIGSYKDNKIDDHEFVKDIQYNPQKYHGPNKMWQRNSSYSQINGDIIANYDKIIEEKHNISVMAGYHAELYKFKHNETFRKNFPSNNLGDINAGGAEGMKANGYTRELSMLSWFGRVKYNFQEKYLFEFNLRADASSRFNKDYRWGYFPSFSAAWRVSEENFMEGLEHIVDNLKIRGSWGKLGNQNIGDFYPFLATYSIGNNYPINDALNTGTAITTAKKSDISWEKTTTWGIGADAQLWGHLNISLDFYNRETTDIIMDAEAPIEFGMNGYKDNIGSMLNRGVEFMAQYLYKRGDWEMNVGGNVAYNHNEILSLGEGIEMMGTGSARWIVGHPINSYYGYKTDGLFQSQDEVDSYPEYVMSGKMRLPGDIKFVDENNDGEITGADRVILKSEQPKFTFGFNMGAKWKMLDFSAYFQGVAGCVRYMADEAYGLFDGDAGTPTEFWADRWTLSNPTNDVPRATLNGGLSLPSTLVSNFWTKDASYLRLKNLQVGFNFPTDWCSKLKIPAARIYYSGQNLITFKKMPKGMDPESPSGRGGSYPQVKVNSFGINVSF